MRRQACSKSTAGGLNCETVGLNRQDQRRLSPFPQSSAFNNSCLAHATRHQYHGKITRYIDNLLAVDIYSVLQGSVSHPGHCIDMGNKFFAMALVGLVVFVGLLAMAMILYWTAAVSCP